MTGFPIYSLPLAPLGHFPDLGLAPADGRDVFPTWD